MNQSIANTRLYIYLGVIVALAIPALFINLGLLPFIEDESIRALVALEMKHSGNYIVPTMNGSYYYSKPPLFNWLILFSSAIWGRIDEFVTRFTTVSLLIGFCWTIYKVNRRHFDHIKYPLMISLFYLTCGRIMFWDSFRGLIDIGFSWVIYLMFIAVYHYGKKEQYWHMYIIAYALAAIAYMFKALPAFVFVGLTIIAFHYTNKSLKKIISLPHIGGILTMSAILGAYYYLYGIYHESTSVIPGLVDQSTQRTVFRHGILKTVKHIFAYPFDNIFHFLPWSVFGVLFLRKDIWKVLKANDYIHYITICFLINIAVYWVSPGVYPRYILMMIPLMFTVLIYLYSLEKEGWRLLLLRRLYQVVIIAVPFFAVGLIGISEVQSVEGWQLKAGLLLVGLFTLAILYFKDRPNRLFILVMLVLILRIAYNWFWMPSRYAKDKSVIAMEHAIEIGEKYKNEKLELYKNGKVDYTSSFYISNTRGAITYRNSEPGEDDKYLIVDTSRTEIPELYEVVDTFRKREDWKLLYVVKRK